MTVRAKFKVTQITIGMGHKKQDDGSYKPVEMRTIKMSPVYANNDPNHENSKFWDASPSGELTLGTINPGAWEKFEMDKEYYLDFTPAA